MSEPREPDNHEATEEFLPRGAWAFMAFMMTSYAAIWFFFYFVMTGRP